MPFRKLTEEQILAVLAIYDEILEVRGVTMAEVGFVDFYRTKPCLVVYIDASHRGGIAQLPTSVAGVPVVVKVENRKTGQVFETIDPRTNGGKWPT